MNKDIKIEWWYTWKMSSNENENTIYSKEQE